MVIKPFCLLCKLIRLLFKKQYLAWALSNQSYSIYQVHLSQIIVSYLLSNKIGPFFPFNLWFYFLYRHFNALTLSIERIKFIFIFVVETLHRKVLVVAFIKSYFCLLRDFSRLTAVYKVMVILSVIVKQINED